MKEGITSLLDFFNSNRIFEIPGYQRNYAWTKEKQLTDFWDDLRYLDETKKYFFGTILLRKNGSITDESGYVTYEKWDIIDGQQRLITTSILIKVLLVKLNELIKKGEFESNKKKFEQIVSEKESIFLRKDMLNKTNPLGDDKDFYIKSIVNFDSIPDDTITPSQKRIKEAKEFFIGKAALLNVKTILGLIKKIECAQVVVYPVENRDEAALIFETVNDRGKPLSNLEKIKSFLMYTVYLSTEESYKVL
ncbi:MAG: DUF262 domain-containing protein, partial [Ignavibacteriales bacterium]|nr:DUF262 domain-containing protein [Ignavibacteriales bacterium]